jgi:hypothetical protein
MPVTDMDRLVIEVRELLVTTKNKDQIVRVLENRGMDSVEARELVQGVYKQNLWENRKMSLLAAIGSGAIFVGLLIVWFATDRLFYVWLPLSGIAMLWGIVKCSTASGYSIEESDD